MKNLYRIEVAHAAPKDVHYATACLVLAANDEQVYEFICSEPEVFGHKMWNGWKDNEEEGKTYDIEDENWKVVGQEPFKDRMIRLKGLLYDEYCEWNDLYYGVTHYGWKLLQENTTKDYSELVELGMCFDLTDEKL